jgi:hypothetical protein
MLSSSNIGLSSNILTSTKVVSEALLIGNLTGSGTRGVSVLASGVLITTSSDIRLKENFEPINESETHLKLLELVPKTYQWKNRERHGDLREIGLIAQEVKEVLPELIFENSDGMYGVNYDKISILMLQSIKQLQKQIDELKNENIQMKNEIIELRRDVSHYSSDFGHIPQSCPPETLP